MNRRGFMKAILSVAGAAIVAPAFVQSAYAQKKRGESAPAGGAPAAGGTVMVDPNDSVAKAVKYVEDHNKAPEAKGNHCSTCGFYKKTGMNAGKEVGTCTIFAGKHVVGNGWCASWNKKA